jgi:methionyl-tRNA formyltransferase
MITKETGRIDWSKSSQSIHNLVRGTDPWPGAYTFYKGERMRVWKTEIINDKLSHSSPGTICEVIKDGLLIAAGNGLLKILELQFDSGKRMNVGTYLAGHKMNEGESLE